MSSAWRRRLQPGVGWIRAAWSDSTPRMSRMTLGRLHAEAKGCSKRSHLFLMPSLGSCVQRLGCPDLIALLLPNQPHNQVDEAGHEYVGK